MMSAVQSHGIYVPHRVGSIAQARQQPVVQAQQRSVLQEELQASVQEMVQFKKSLEQVTANPREIGKTVSGVESSLSSSGKLTLSCSDFAAENGIVKYGRLPPSTRTDLELVKLKQEVTSIHLVLQHAIHAIESKLDETTKSSALALEQVIHDVVQLRNEVDTLKKDVHVRDDNAFERMDGKQAHEMISAGFGKFAACGGGGGGGEGGAAAAGGAAAGGDGCAPIHIYGLPLGARDDNLSCSPFVETQARALDSELEADSGAKKEQHWSRAATLEGHLQHETYALKESIWDAGILFGLLGMQNNGYLGITMLINLVVQSVFSIIVWIAFSDPDMEEDSDFFIRVWRGNDGHDVANTNAIWPYSLASRICDGDVSLSLSGQQQFLHDAINLYRPAGAEFFGELMCVLCLVCFWSILWADCKETMAFATGLICAVGERTRIIAFDDEIRFESFGPERSVLGFATVLLRFAVFVNVGMIGTVWLTNTVAVDDLLLNALALELVLHVDELIYQALAPVMVKAFLAKVTPLKTWSMQHKLGIDIQALSGLLLFVGLLPIVYLWRVRHTSLLVKAAEYGICGGQTNFVYGVDALGVVHVHNEMAQLSDFDLSKEAFDADIRMRALQQVIDGVPREDWQYAIHAPSVEQLKQTVSKPLALALSLGNDCQDILSTTNCQNIGTCPQYRQSWRYATGDMNLEWCSDAEVYCYGLSTAALLTKALCPGTCGCASLYSGVYVTGGVQSGIDSCPIECAVLLQDVHNNLDFYGGQCFEDLDADSSMWQLWMVEARDVLDSTLQEPLEKQGCRGLQGHSNAQEFCEGKGVADALKPLSVVCPKSCGCKEGLESAICPWACTCKHRDLGFAGPCASDSCKRRAISDGWIEGFPVKNIDDANKVCGCPDFFTGTSHQIQKAMGDAMCGHICPDVAASVDLSSSALSQCNGSASSASTSKTSCDLSCASDCTKSPADCTEFEQFANAECASDCPVCAVKMISANLGCD